MENDFQVFFMISGNFLWRGLRRHKQDGRPAPAYPPNFVKDVF